MKKFIVICAIAILAGLLLQRLTQQDAGYLLIVAWGKTIEIRLGFAIVLAALAGLVLWLVVRTLRLIVGGARGVGASSRSKRERKRQRATEEGILLLLRDDPDAGQKRFEQVVKHRGHLPWQVLAAARCALERRDYVQADTLLAKAAAEPGVDETTLLLMQADSAFGRGEWSRCAAALNKAKTKDPGSTAVLKRLQRLYEATGDWPALETLMGELERTRAYSPADLRALKERLAYMRLGLYGEELERTPESERGEMAGVVAAYWQNLPKALTGEPRFIQRYTHILILLGDETKAEGLLRQALKSQWQPELVLLYGALQKVDARQQLSVARHWQELHPQDSALQLTLGRICLRNQLWGQARDHFKASLKLNPQPETYAELARLLAQLGDSENSLAAYRQGLLQTANNWYSIEKKT